MNYTLVVMLDGYPEPIELMVGELENMLSERALEMLDINHLFERGDVQLRRLSRP